MDDGLLFDYIFFEHKLLIKYNLSIVFILFRLIFIITIVHPESFTLFHIL